LFDWDPDGVRILKCYRYGSKALAREHNCNVPEMRWIGLKANDVISQENLAHDSYIPLTMRDRAVAVSMLASEEWRDQSGVVLPGMGETLVELRRMLMLNRKAEIQILDDREGGLDGWLTKSLRK